MIKKRALIPLATGFEELEAVTVVDLLRRAKIDVIVAGLTGKQPVTGSRGVLLVPDVSLADVLNDDFDLIVLPGGLTGAHYLRDDLRIIKLLQRHDRQGSMLAAICAAPLVLLQAGLLTGKSVTAFPGVLDTQNADYRYTANAVEQSSNVLTSRGPGTAIDFSLLLIEQLLGLTQKQEVESGLVR